MPVRDEPPFLLVGVTAIAVVVCEEVELFGIEESELFGGVDVASGTVEYKTVVVPPALVITKPLSPALSTTPATVMAGPPTAISP